MGKKKKNEVLEKSLSEELDRIIDRKKSENSALKKIVESLNKKKK